KGTFRFAIKRHALQSSWVVGHGSLVVCSDGHLVILRVDALDAGVISSFDSQGLAPATVTNSVALLVPFRPLPIGARDLLARRQYERPMLVAIDVALALHRSVDNVVEILSRLVVRRDDECRLRVFDVLVRDGGQALLARDDFMHAPL